jgi:hypothetical protein
MNKLVNRLFMLVVMIVIVIMLMVMIMVMLMIMIVLLIMFMIVVMIMMLCVIFRIEDKSFQSHPPREILNLQTTRHPLGQLMRIFPIILGDFMQPFYNFCIILLQSPVRGGRQNSREVRFIDPTIALQPSAKSILPWSFKCFSLWIFYTYVIHDP